MLRKILGALSRSWTYSNPNLDIATDFVTGRNVAGDYFEFGVHAGNSFIYAYRELMRKRSGMLKHHEKNRLPVPPDLNAPVRFFAFDSFEGLPVATGIDKSSKLPSHWVAGQFKAPEDVFLGRLQAAKIPIADVGIIKGWYKDTLTPATKLKFKMSKGCIFHVDCDLYESTVSALDFIADLYVDGSVLIFDDWFGFKGNPDFGQQRAFSEWKEKYKVRASELSRFGGQSVAFIIHAD